MASIFTTTSAAVQELGGDDLSGEISEEGRGLARFLKLSHVIGKFETMLRRSGIGENVILIDDVGDKLPTRGVGVQVPTPAGDRIDNDIDEDGYHHPMDGEYDEENNWTSY